MRYAYWTPEEKCQVRQGVRQESGVLKNPHVKDMGGKMGKVFTLTIIFLPNYRDSCLMTIFFQSAIKIKVILFNRS